MRTEIRKAQLSDVPWLISELKDFSKLYGTKRPLYDGNDEYCRGAIEQLVTNHVILIAELRGEDHKDCIGFIGGYVSLHPFNPAIKTLCETFWWISEEYRGGRAAIQLLDAFTLEGEKLGAHWITVSSLESNPLPDKLLNRRGYILRERAYVMEIN